MNDLIQLKRGMLPGKILLRAYQHFRQRGDEGCEGVALWVGRLQDDTFEITDIVIPEQTGIRSDQGLAYVVRSDALHRFNVWLYESGLRLIAQVHSHPTDAYHSETDDLYPIMTTLGGFSVVVPNFGRGLPSLPDCAVFRLTVDGWKELGSGETKTLFQVI
jgi:hypothetical protein